MNVTKLIVHLGNDLPDDKTLLAYRAGMSVVLDPTVPPEEGMSRLLEYEDGSLFYVKVNKQSVSVRFNGTLAPEHRHSFDE